MQVIPNDFLCPITLEIMNEPVICSDGYTYERQSILALHNNISPITRQLINRDFLIPNRALKNLIEEYKENKFNTSYKKENRLQELERKRDGMLAKFEYEQELKRIERENKLREEHLKKEKLEKEIQLKKQLQEQENIKLERILTMFNSKNTETFTYGNFHTGNYGMNNIRNTQFSFSKCGEHKYIFSLDFLKKLANLNKDLLLEKYKKLMQDYIWVNKYVLSEGTNPFIEFVFDELVPNMHNTRLINLKSKEYYITNYDEFCKDFKIPQNYQRNYNMSYNIYNGKEFNIIQSWAKAKQKMFNTLIDNIKDIQQSQERQNRQCRTERQVFYSDTHNMITYRETHNLDNSIPMNKNIHILDMYNNVIQFYTQISCIDESYKNKTDLQSDYEPNYFKPLINLTKNIIELIEFIRPDIIVELID